MDSLSASDVLALTNNKDGIFGGNGILVLIVLILLLGGGLGGMGFGNNAASQGALTRAEMNDGFTSKGIQDSIRGVQQGLCDGFYAQNTTMLNGFNGVERDLCSGIASINSAINQLGYNLQNCCCEIKQTVLSDGSATRAMFQNDTIQKLRDSIADKDRELLATGLVAAQGVQTQNIQNFLKDFLSCGKCC